MHTQIVGAQSELPFTGSAFESKFDRERLTKQILRVFNLMCDGRWRTVSEIADIIHDPENSIQAQLRNLRKGPFGRHTVVKRSRGDRSRGLYEYQLTVNERNEF
jgi:hypothetical protein